MEDNYKEERANPEYVKLAKEMSYRANKRELGLPIRSEVPIPYKPRSLLERIFNW